jgi:mono/diheme cytochrome c family protein
MLHRLTFVFGSLLLVPCLLGQVHPRETFKDPANLERYAVHCAPCHGARGRGDGPAARFLDPIPRDFAAGRFKLVSTVSGRPARADLAQSIRHGMPGTAMLSFDHLGDEAIEGLADMVLAFRRDGLTALLAPEASTEEELDDWLREELNAGPPIAVPKVPTWTAEAAARGRLSYLTLCSRCHGPDGRANHPPPLHPEGDEPYFPRDLGLGVLKGGNTPADLFRRIRCGMPGTVMPSVSPEVLPDGELWDLVAFLQTLIPERTQALSLPRGVPIRPTRIEPPCPTRADDPRLANLPTFPVPVVPFRRDEATISGLLVQAATDGTHLIFRLRYGDATRNPSTVAALSPPDGVAIRLSALAHPPVLPIPGQPLPLDRALWLAGSMPDEHDPVFDGKTPRFVNPDSVCKSPIGPERVGDGSWRDQVWTVLLPLRPERSRDLSGLGPKAVSFAIFDGHHARGPLPAAFSPWCPLE